MSESWARNCQFSSPFDNSATLHKCSTNSQRFTKTITWISSTIWIITSTSMTTACIRLTFIESPTSRRHLRQSPTTWCSRSNNFGWLRMAGKCMKTGTGCLRVIPWWAPHRHPQRPSKSSAAKSPPAPCLISVSCMIHSKIQKRGKPDEIDNYAAPPRRFHF